MTEIHADFGPDSLQEASARAASFRFGEAGLKRPVERPITRLALTPERGRLTIMETREEEVSARQMAQEELVQEAQKNPGVAEAMAAYRAFAPYTETGVAPARSTISYATGGNSRAPGV